MKQKVKRGGAREGSGRKTMKTDKKIAFILYLRPSDIMRLAGQRTLHRSIPDAKEIMYAKLEEELGLPHCQYYNSKEH